MTKEQPDALIRGMTDFVRRELSQLNTEAESSQDPTPLILATAPWLERMKTLVLDADTVLPRRVALRLLQLASFPVSSVERHMQPRGEPKGSGVKRLGMTEALLRLGTVASHIPRDDHVLYWLDNRDEPLTFTGDRSELLFNANVNLTQDLFSVSASVMRPICDGNVPLKSTGAVDAIHFAAANTQKLHSEYRHFMEPSTAQPAGWAMTPLAFMRLRQYLVSYPVGDATWPGPNAANIIGQPQNDFLIGTVLDFYRDIVTQRFVLLSEEERESLSADMTRPSLFDRFLAAIGLDDRPPELLTRDAIASALGRRPGFEPVAKAIRELVNAAAHLSAYHYALIMNYLVKPSFPADVVRRSTVPPNRGTGNHGHDETRRIMEMRTRHPVGSNIVAAVDEVVNSPAGAH